MAVRRCGLSQHPPPGRGENVGRNPVRTIQHMSPACGRRPTLAFSPYSARRVRRWAVTRRHVGRADVLTRDLSPDEFADLCHPAVRRRHFYIHKSAPNENAVIERSCGTTSHSISPHMGSPAGTRSPEDRLGSAPCKLLMVTMTCECVQPAARLLSRGCPWTAQDDCWDRRSTPGGPRKAHIGPGHQDCAKPVPAAPPASNANTW